MPASDSRQSAAPLLRIRGLRKVWTRRSWFAFHNIENCALDHIDLDLAPAECAAVIGPSGCGKSTLARCITGIESPTDGTIFFERRDTSSMSHSERIAYRRRVQLIPQDPGASLDPRLTVRQNIEEPLIIRRLARWTIRDRALKSLAEVGMDNFIDVPSPEHLSGGQRARLAISRALAALDLSSGPSLLILDESLSSLDLSTRAQIMNLLIDLQEAHQLALLLIDHDPHVVECLAARVYRISATRTLEPVDGIAAGRQEAR